MLETWFRRFQRYAHKPWYALVLCVFAASDAFLVIIPTDGLLVSSIFLAPKRWLEKCIAVAVGSTIGSALLFLCVQSMGISFLERISPGVTATRSWTLTHQWMDVYGLWAVFAVALSPIFQHPAVAISALMETPLDRVVVAVLVGRLIKYLVISWAASHSPKILFRFGFMRKELDEVGAHKDGSVDSVTGPQK
jgi:membrane protein YqaA with SNARE-associated domain